MPLIPKILILLTSVFSFHPNVWAADWYEPVSQRSLAERWRWSELEALGNGGYIDAVEGLGGDVWFLSKKEVVRYNGANVDRFALPECDWVAGIFSNGTGSVIVLTSQGCLSLAQGKWNVILPPTSEIGVATSAYASEDGSIWFGGSGGFIRIHGSDTNVYRADLLAVNSMVVDFDGVIWASELDGKTIYILNTNESLDGQLKIDQRIEVANATDRISLSQDSLGRIWCHARDRTGNVYRIDRGKLEVGIAGTIPQARNVDVLRMAELASDWLVFVGPRVIMESKRGEIRFYTSDDHDVPTADSFALALSNGKLLIGDSESRPEMIDLSDDRWMSLQNLNFQCEGEKGRSWFLEHDGRVVLSEDESRKWTQFGVEDGVIEHPNRLFCSRDGTVWASGMHGGYAATSRYVDGKWIRDTFEKAGAIFSHLGVAESEDGSILFGVGTPSWRLDGQTGGVVVYRKRDGRWHGELKSPPLYPVRGAVLTWRSGDGVWIGGDALWRKPSFGALEEFPIQLAREGHWIDHALVDSDNRLWVAAWGLGVHRYDGTENTLLSESSGLASNQVIHLLEAEGAESVWALTSKGLSRWDGNVWSNWGLPFGRLLRRESNTLRKDSSGAIWLNFAYRSWLMTGELNELKALQYRTVRYKNTGLAPETKIVRADDSLIEGSSVYVEWRGQDQWSESSVEELEYSWRVGEGEWSAFTAESSVVLGGLVNGINEFQVRARDRDWNVDTSPAIARIQIVPVMWKRPWFIVAVATTFGLIVFLVVRLFKLKVQAALEVEEFKLDFFTNISHELKNPLAVIIGPLESSLEYKLPSAIKFRLELALKNARKMQGLIQELLQFRKLERGKAKYHPSSGEVVGFIRDSVEMLEPLWKQKGQAVVFESNEPYFVCGYDAEKLQKIVDNLLANAIKYSNEGSRIEARVSVYLEDDRRMLRFEVEDEGPGISQLDQNRVLQPFVRTQESRENSDGLGLGLAMTNELVRVCGGTLRLESPVNDDGAGTRATVVLPLSSSLLDEVKEDVESAEGADSDESSEGERIGRPKILLVEDSEDLRSFMRDELSEHYEILEAANGRVGLDLAVNASPDLIVTDVMMPELDGIELCRRLRAEVETSHIPIVMLTARSSEEDQLAGAEAGADVYFAKPLNMRRLAAQIENLIELRKGMMKRFSEMLVIEPSQLTVVSSDQELLGKAIKVVEERIADPEFDVEGFASAMALGRTTFYKKLKALTGMPPNAFIRSMRLKRAAQLLQTGKHSVSDVLEYVAIYDLSYFSRVFKKEFGMSPTSYIAKHSKRVREE